MGYCDVVTVNCVLKKFTRGSSGCFDFVFETDDDPGIRPGEFGDFSFKPAIDFSAFGFPAATDAPIGGFAVMRCTDKGKRFEFELRRNSERENMQNILLIPCKNGLGLPSNRIILILHFLFRLPK